MNALPERAIRLLIVDDHEIVRAGLRTVLTPFREIGVVGEAGSIVTAIDAIDRLQPDVVLLDVRLPDGDGFAVCQEIQKRNLETRFIILTSFADDDLITQFILAGAEGYLLKEIDGPGLLRAIKDVDGGKSILDPAITRRVMSKLKGSSETAITGKLETLSSQERKVLALVAEGKTNKEIGVALELSDKTIKNYLSNVLEKLQLTRRSQAAVYYTRQTAK